MDRLKLDVCVQINKCLHGCWNNEGVVEPFPGSGCDYVLASNPLFTQELENTADFLKASKSFLEIINLRCHFPTNQDFLIPQNSCQIILPTSAKLVLNCWLLSSAVMSKCIICHGRNFCLENVFLPRYSFITKEMWLSKWEKATDAALCRCNNDVFLLFYPIK